ncbi:MAG: hypothetical protein M3Q03_21305 [Chloroflexota bacterium]|nr:hypothetical protein [Chloroflexota bacterium]
MSDHGKRLAKLESIYQRPLARTAPPFDPSRLTVDELGELRSLGDVLRAVDVGPSPLDHRANTRARLDTLTDEQLNRLETLRRKGWGIWHDARGRVGSRRATHP